MVLNRSAPAATVVPVLVYEDVNAALTFLVRAFGFEERLRVTSGGGRVVHAQLTIGDGAVMIGAQGAEFRAPASIGVTHFVVVHVDDVDAHWRRAQDVGARIVRPPTDMPFGERQYTAEDPGGHRWSFSQSLADVAPEVWGATMA